MPSTTDYCFTLHADPDFEDFADQMNNVVEKYVDHPNFFRKPFVKFYCFQIEIGSETGRPHLQGFIQFTKRFSYAGVKAAVPVLQIAHLEARRGTVAEAIEYCRKERSRVDGFEFVEWGTNDSVQGQRTDRTQLVQYIQEGHSVREVANTFPALTVLHFNSVQQLCAMYARPPPDEEFQPRPWQQHVLNLLAAEPDDRTIIWVYDHQGNKGKSRLTRHLLTQHNAALLEGNIANMAYLWAQHHDHRIAVFDISRSQAEFTDHLYAFAEKIKNRYVVSTKYQSRVVHTGPVHVIFFANHMPDRNKWTGDRLHLIDLGTFDPAAAAAQQQALRLAPIFM